jgi:catechol 2,3-dioxygenase-like lactoylglutathione lyase family enzyme
VSIELRAEDAEDCAAFYELLGFRRVEPPPTLAHRTVWVERGGTQVHLMFVEEEPVIPPSGHLAVVLDDYDATLAALRDTGHDPESRTEHWGAPRAFVHDPAGHRVEVMAAPPPRSDA